MLSAPAGTVAGKYRRIPVGSRRYFVQTAAGMTGGIRTALWLGTRTADRFLALYVADSSRCTVVTSKNIVHMAVILRPDSEARMSKVMTAEDYKRERLYMGTMSIARRMLSEGMIRKSDYRAYDMKMRQKYRPVFGTLFTEILAS